MVNKKIFVLILGMFFLIFWSSGFVNSSSWYQKIDWTEQAFEWSPNTWYISRTSSTNVCDYENRNVWTHWTIGNLWYNVKCHWSASDGWHFASDHTPNGNREDDWDPENSAYVYCIDWDSDNYASSSSHTACGVKDCDDNDVQTYPQAPEVCDNKDNTCEYSGNIDETFTNKGSTCFVGVGACKRTGIYVCKADETGTECSVTAPGSPSTEICGNEIDEDCNGVNEVCTYTVTLTPCTDADDDNYCVESSGASCISTNICDYFGDCLDTVFTNGVNIHPGATEICNDYIDNDCNQQIDSADSFCPKAFWGASNLQIITTPLTASDNSPQTVYLIVEKTPPPQNAYFEVWEKDSLGGDDAIKTKSLGTELTGGNLGNKIITQWTIGSSDKTLAATDDLDEVYDFYFKLYDSSNNLIITSPNLQVTWQTGPPCTNGDTQSCYTGASGTEGVGVCKEGTQTCANGVWGTCVGEITPTTEICGNDIDEDCNGIKEETGCPTTPVDCPYDLCSQITFPTECNSCPVSSLDGCSWNSATTSCNPYENLVDLNNNVIGTCEYTEDTTDTCEDDGVLDYSLTLTADSHIDCAPKEPVSIFCSAQTSLPLENKFGILLTIISIIGIYFLFFRKNKHLKIKNEK